MHVIFVSVIGHSSSNYERATVGEPPLTQSSINKKLKTQFRSGYGAGYGPASHTGVHVSNGKIAAEQIMRRARCYEESATFRTSIDNMLDQHLTGILIRAYE